MRKWFSSTSFTFDQGMKEFMRTKVPWWGTERTGDRTWKTGRLKRSLDHGPMPQFREIQVFVFFFQRVFPCFARLDHTHPFSSACRMVASKLVPEVDTSIFFFVIIRGEPWLVLYGVIIIVITLWLFNAANWKITIFKR